MCKLVVTGSVLKGVYHEKNIFVLIMCLVVVGNSV